MPSTQWTPIESLKSYGRVLARKMSFVAIGWVILYFISWPFRKESDLPVLWLFAPMLGGLGGLVAGWYLSTDAGEESGMGGLPLWVILVLASVAPMWIVEWIMYLIMHRPMTMGAFMEVGIANLLALAAAVYHCETQN